MQNLNPLTLNLSGTMLIESSAGTGKTYVLIILYLRLLLHLGGQSAFLRPLNIQEILVVTFTTTAVESLRRKIKENIRQFRLDCTRGHSDNYLFSNLLTQIHDRNHAIIQLLQAEERIHQASIFTIHSFCQRILTQNTIELNMLFDVSIVNNEITLYKQACTDFWRKFFYPLPLNIAKLIQEYWKNPDFLLKDILPHIYGEYPKICYPTIFSEKKDISKYYNQTLIIINEIKKLWNLHINNILSIINCCKINRNIYNKKNLIYWTNKINQWTSQPTIDHIVPKDLKRFTSSALNIHNNHENIHIHSLFNKIEDLHLRLLSFKSLIFSIAIHEIRQDLRNAKYSTSKVTFDDLIDLVEYHITTDTTNNLAHIIRTRYPVAIIDEFQDTDQQQYKIFHKLYFKHEKNALILIGDPKQSIYSFRRADIFTYMKARRIVHNQYKLNINWRSSSGMVNAINQLFQYKSDPFIFQEIPFIPSITAYPNNTHQFLINNQPQTAMCFWLHPGTIVTIEDYKHTMAQECAVNLHNLLHKIHNKTAWVKNKTYKRLLQASDITILVRNHEEASFIQKELSKLNISTVFLSNQKNIFETIESYDLLLLLQAIFFLEKKMICTALTTIFFRLNAANIENIKNNEFKWEKIINEFSEYYIIWKKNGIYSMILKIIFKYKIPEILLSLKKGENKLVNILHLSELLQNVSIQLKNEYNLIQWLTSKLTQTHDNKNKNTSSEELLRLNSDHQLIKISTIHKSKGLEFPLIFLPFIANFNYIQNSTFHDRKSHLICVDFNRSTLHMKLADEERLSEDLRLLYVAITRSIYHCSIGIAPIIYKHTKKSNTSDLHRCALGYLIQRNTIGNSELLKENLKMLSIRSHGDISFRYIPQLKKYLPTTPITILKKNETLSAKSWTNSNYITPSWTITSYSNLKYTDSSNNLNFQEQLNIDEYLHKLKNNHLLTPHTFPKGKVYGNFFHDLFKILDFTKPIDHKWLKIHIDKYNFHTNWQPIIEQWLHTIINTPLNQNNLTLSKINSSNKIVELKFYLPINTYLTSQKLNILCKNYDLLSSKSPSLNFLQTKGMLKGFIDLTFRWKQQYYLLDYKTNWLGNNDDAYIYSNIEKEMIKNNYMLQYQLYTLALHRFLRHRIVSYDYKKDFGGIYYLFIRGMNRSQCNNGVYFIHPPSLIFIEKLDNLFSKK